MVMGLKKQNLQGSRTPMSNAYLLVRCHMLSRRALHSWFGVMDCICLSLQENKMFLRNNGIFLLVIIISPVYLHQGPTKLGNTLPGTLSNRKFTKLWSFQAKQKGEMGTGEDMIYLHRDRNWPSHKFGEVKLLHLPHIPWNFQAKPLAAKAPVSPRHCLAHLPEEMLKHGLVPSTGRSYQVSNTADTVPKDFSPSQRAEMGLESLLNQGVLLQRLCPWAQINHLAFAIVLSSLV